MTPLSVSIIGCGRIAFEFENDPLRKKPASHYGAISTLPDLFYLHSICDHDPNRLKIISERTRIPRSFSDPGQLFADSVPDIAVIAVSTPSHVAVAQAAIAAGVKGIVLEKPVSPSLRDARKLLALQEQTGIPILVFHERRYDPLFQWAAHQIQSGCFGPVRSIHARLCSASYPRGDMDKPYLRHGGGSLFHDGTHMVDILNFLFSPFQTVSATLQHEDPDAAVETGVRSFLTTNSGLPVTFVIDSRCAYFHFELDIFFQSFRLRVGNGIRELQQALRAKQYSGFSSLQTRPFPPLPLESPFINAYQDLHRAVTTGSPLLSSLRDGVLALEHIYGIYRSGKGNGRTVRYPLRGSNHPLADTTFFIPVGSRQCDIICT